MSPPKKFLPWQTSSAELYLIRIRLNTAINSATKTSSFKLLFNHVPSCTLANLWDINDFISSHFTTEQRMENWNKAIMNALRSTRLNRQHQRFSPTTTSHPFKLNSLVYIRTHYLHIKTKTFCKKLVPRYIGIYKIICWFTDVTRSVQKLDDPTDVRKIHIIYLKMYEANE